MNHGVVHLLRHKLNDLRSFEDKRFGYLVNTLTPIANSCWVLYIFTEMFFVHVS